MNTPKPPLPARGRKLHVWVERNIQMQCFNFGIHQWNEKNEMFAAEILMKPFDPDIAAPAANLSQEEAQLLMDYMWAAGLRPSCEGSAGQLAATEKHLEDMRGLTQKLLGHLLTPANVVKGNP